jgi:hypothetical protein
MTEPRQRWRSRITRMPGILLLIVAVVGAGFAIGFGNWTPVSFSGTVTTSGIDCGYGCNVIIVLHSFPARENVSVRWTDETSGTVTFRILAPSPGIGPLITQCEETGTTGGCNFISALGNYTFQAFALSSEGPQTVDFTATYLVALF